MASLLLLAYLLILGYLTLFRFYQVNPGYNLIPGRTIAHDLGKGGAELLINFFGNIAATVPLGMLLPMVVPRQVRTAMRAALASFLTSVLIEVSQRWLGLRVADVDDVILNTLGGWLGYGLGLVWRRWLRMRSESCIPAGVSGAGRKTPRRVLP